VLKFVTYKINFNIKFLVRFARHFQSFSPSQQFENHQKAEFAKLENF
jgi:hypothetical protein